MSCPLLLAHEPCCCCLRAAKDLWSKFVTQLMVLEMLLNLTLYV